MSSSTFKRVRLFLETLEPRECPNATWTGAGLDSLASNTANWDVLRQPTADETITFDGVAAKGNKNATMDIAFSSPVQALVVSGYTGQITFTKDISLKKFTLASGSIDGSSTITIVPDGNATRQFQWLADGTIGNNDGGRIVFEPGTDSRIRQIGAFTGALNGWTIDNYGSFTWTGRGGTISLLNGAKINNYAGATLYVQQTISGQPFLFDASQSPTSRFSNEGLVETEATNVEFRVNVSGCGDQWILGIGPDVSEDVLISRGSSFCSSQFNENAASVRLILAGGVGVTNSLSNVDSTGPGKLALWSSTVQVSGYFNVQNAEENYLSTLTGDGAVNINGTFTYISGNWTGWANMNVAQGATLNFSLSQGGVTDIQRSIVNNGTVNVASPSETRFVEGTNITNNAGGVINFTDGNTYWQAVGIASTPKLDNSGVINIKLYRNKYIRGFDYSGSGQLNIKDGNVGTVQMGKIQVKPGGKISLENNGAVSATGTFTIQAGGSVSGFGTITAPLLDNQGEIDVGNSSLLGVSLSVFGNYQQEAGATLSLFVGANGLADSLNVQGMASLSGTLLVSYAVGYTPQVGDSWTLVQSTSPISGAFTNLQLPPGMVLDFTDPTKIVARIAVTPLRR